MREQTEAEGHAVRAMYLYSAMADLARLRGDGGLADACRRLWDSVTRRRMYITGGIGSSAYGEAFTFDHDLPNDTAYTETCAAIGLVFFARRMLLLEPDGRYGDVMERALYNGVLSGMQLDGSGFFYVNPLEVTPEACRLDRNKDHVQYRRQPWFGCACCPPNLARLLMSLQDYVFAVSGSTVHVHLYVSGDAELTLPGGVLRLRSETGYPWSGRIRFTAETPCPLPCTLALRIPGWSPGFRLLVNGEAVSLQPQKGYAYLERVWQSGDTVELELELRPLLCAASPEVSEDAGRAAAVCGPLVYCAEEADNGPGLHKLSLDPAGAPELRLQPQLQDGVREILWPGYRDLPWPEGSELYRPWSPPRREKVTLRLIPYYAWANRSPGEMRVWLRLAERI